MNSGDNYLDTHHEAGTYLYRIRACSDGGCSDWGAEFQLVNQTQPPPATPSLGVTSGSSSSFTVSWDSAAGATSYRLEERVDGGSWTEVYNGSGTSKAFSGKAAAKYRYRVRACNSPCSSWSAVATRWVVPTAPNLAVSGTSTGNHSISWAPVPGADRYILEEKKVVWLQVHDGSGNNVLLPNRQPWTYYYRIRACNGGGCGSWGQEMKVVSQGGGGFNPPGPGEP